MEKHSLVHSLRVYWLHLLVMFLAPVLTVATMIFLKPLWPIVFLSSAAFATVIPYRFGKAPASYLFACQVAFVLGGFFVPLVACALWAAGVPEEVIDQWWDETSK